MNWNQDILNNDELSATDKFVYHLLADLGDGAETRRQIAEMAGISDRHFRRIAVKLRTYRSETDIQVRTSVSETDIQVRNGHTSPESPNACANITAFTNVKASFCTTNNNNNNGVDDVEENTGKDDPIIQENDIAAPIDTNDLIADLDDEERESFAEMLDIWADLDPEARCLDPGPWFKKLIRAYGHKIAAGGLLRLQITNFWIEGLENPKAYAGYIVKVLDGLKETGLLPLGENPPVNGGITSAANNPYKSNKNDPHYDKWSDPAQFVGLPASSITAECAE